jgi:hypothetical protein
MSPTGQNGIGGKGTVKENHKIVSKWKKATKNHNQVEAHILDQRTSKNGGWLTTTDQLMCLQHLYLGSSTPTTMYPMYVPWLTNSALVYEPKCGGRGGELRGLSQ